MLPRELRHANKILRQNLKKQEEKVKHLTEKLDIANRVMEVQDKRLTTWKNNYEEAEYQIDSLKRKLKESNEIKDESHNVSMDLLEKNTLISRINYVLSIVATVSIVAFILK